MGDRSTKWGITFAILMPILFGFLMIQTVGCGMSSSCPTYWETLIIVAAFPMFLLNKMLPSLGAEIGNQTYWILVTALHIVYGFIIGKLLYSMFGRK